MTWTTDVRDTSTPPLRTRVRARATAVRRALLRRRRLLAVLCVAGAVAAGLRAAAPPAPATAQLLVAAHDLPAGAALGAGDLRAVSVPPAAVPAGVAADPLGATLAAPLRAGEPVTDARLVGPGLADAAPGTVALPVRLSDAGQADLLTVGDEIDLLATDPRTADTVRVADGAVVLALPAASDSGVGATTAGGVSAGRVVVLGVASAEVQQVTSAMVVSFVTYAWQSR